MIIRPNDSLEQLVAVGILPQWIADDAELHGMDRAEYILNEFDWEWDWDLGDGYDERQWEILQDVRRKIQDGIREYYANKELVTADEEKVRSEEFRKEHIEELRKIYCDHYIDRSNFKWMVDYEDKCKSLPIMHFICFRTLLPSRTDLKKAILMRIGASCDEPMGSNEIRRRFPDLSGGTVKGLAFHNWPLVKRYGIMVEEAVAALPNPIPAENDPYWTEIIETQRLDVLGMTPARLRRLMTFFSLNKKPHAQKRKGSAGIY